MDNRTGPPTTPPLSHAEQRAERALQAALRAPRLTSHQRFRHLERVREQPTRGGIMRRSGTVIATGVCVVAILLVLILPGRLMGGDNDSPGATSVTSVGASAGTASIASSATEATPPVAVIAQTTSNCNVTPATEVRPVDWNPVWYQLGSIWIGPVLPGAGGPHPTEHDAGSLWFIGLQQMGLVFNGEETLPLEVTPIDAETGLPTGDTLDIAVSHSQDTPEGLIAGGSVDLPATGCWQITSPKIPEAAINIDVRPFEERLDVVEAVNQQIAATTVEPPAACGADAWIVADPFGYAYAVYVMERDGIVLELGRPGVIKANQEMGLTVRSEVDGPTSLRLIPLSNPDTVIDVDTMAQVKTTGPTRVATLTFPHDGCWGLEVETGGERASFTLFVQPE